jgi:chemosensory pili system protein ChpA (sensor histidine kinase/response regulator)
MAFTESSETTTGPEQVNTSPLQAAWQMALAELQSLLNNDGDTALPTAEALREIIESHLDNLEFVFEAMGSDELLQCLNRERAWARDALNGPEIESACFLAEVLERLAALPCDSAQTDEDANESGAGSGQPCSAPGLFTDERLGMLYEELSDFEEPLAQQALIITSQESDNEALLDQIAGYSELLERVVGACEALGLNGLQQVLEFVIENVNLLPTLNPSERLAVRPLLGCWLGAVKQYLVDPADDEALMGLLELMQAAVWPARFDGLDSRDLYLELSSGADDEESLSADAPRPTHAEPQDVSLEIGGDINPQLFDAFMREAPDVAAQFNQVISVLATADDPFAGMRAAQRLSHTLKGSANLVGVTGVANLAHHIEDIFDTLTRRHLAPSGALIAVLHEAADCLESMTDAVAGRDSAPDDAIVVLQRVLDLANLIDNGDYHPSVDLQLPDSAETSGMIDTSEAAASAAAAATPARETIRVATTTIDAMYRLVEEITIGLAQINEHISRIKQRSESLNLHDRNLQLRRFDLENLVDVRGIAAMQKRLHNTRHSEQSFDPLEMDQYDELHGATHSYIEAVADAREISSQLHNEILELDGFLLRQSRLNKELQQLVSATRMVPISDITGRLQRAVRQAARATGNAAELTIEDHNLMMDGDVLNKLVAPLLHILRNAVDHGMSLAGEGDAPGRVSVRFRQEGNNVVIRCADNGRGLDYPRIREVAIERDMLRPEQEPEHAELAQLILTPAFTTRSSATQVSGRGIGMDAVLTAVTELKGSVSVRDVEPHGTEVVIRLPLSMVTTHSLVVRSGGQLYAIPTANLTQILPPGSGELREREEGYTFHLEREVFRLDSLAALLGREEGTAPSDSTILLSGRGVTPAAICVDQVLQSTELVIKRLGRFVPKVPGVAGVTVLGDGRVVPVLDLPELLAAARESSPASRSVTRPAAPLRTVSSRPAALVVDDSLSARNTLGQLLEDTGYEVLTARDGVEAMEVLQKERPLVVLADLEMPRMDGIELTRHIRSSESLQALPVVMITSRSQKKHRQVAEAAGVNAYLTKPFLDDELIDVVTSLV